MTEFQTSPFFIKEYDENCSRARHAQNARLVNSIRVTLEDGGPLSTPEIEARNPKRNAKQIELGLNLLWGKKEAILSKGLWYLTTTLKSVKYGSL